jgi:uncharacterized protein (TIGR00251 family)
MPLPAYLRAEPDGVLLLVKVQPRASANRIGDAVGNELKIKITAPPVDSAANDALIRFLADTLDCGRNQIELVRGHTSRHKTLKIRGLNVESVAACLRPG